MGSLISYFFGISESEEIDSGTGLTANQRALVQKCWNFIEKDILEIGMEIMITFFQDYPQYQEAFPLFRGRELSELTKDRKFHAHCLLIMGTFSQAIEFINDAELCSAGLRMTGERHARRGQNYLPFAALEPITNRILKKYLGKKCTPRASEALDKVLALAFREIKCGIDEHNQQASAIDDP